MDLNTAAFADSAQRCPFPNCKRPSLCPRHAALVPESLLDSGDYRTIRNYFVTRLRFAELAKEAS